MSVDPEVSTERRDAEEDLVTELDGWQPQTGVLESHGELVFAIDPFSQEGGGVLLEGPAAFEDLDAVACSSLTAYLDTESEPVEQLRADIALLGIHRADEDEARGVRERNALSLDGVDAHGSGIEQGVYEMIVEQVDLIDVEDRTVRIGQQTGLESALPMLEDVLDVDRSNKPVLGSRDGQVDDCRSAGGLGKRAVLSAIATLDHTRTRVRPDRMRNGTHRRHPYRGVRRQAL